MVVVKPKNKKNKKKIKNLWQPSGEELGQNPAGFAFPPTVV